MSIIFQCEHCEKNIEVSDELGGQMGQCPHCEHSMYIPLADGGESEALELTEIDLVEEDRIQKEIDQSRETMRQILSDRTTAKAARRGNEKRVAEPVRQVKPIDPEDAAQTVEQYVVAMAWSQLEEAEALAAHLVGNPWTVNPIITKALKEGLSNASLENIPEAVQKGFLKKLFEDLNQSG